MALQPMYPGQPNSPQTELASAIDDEQTTIPLLDASVLPAPPNLATLGTGEDAETILYKGVEGNTLTGVTRGFQGTPKAWVQGTKVARNFTAYDYDALRENLEDHAAATTGVHGATSTAAPNTIVQRDSSGRAKFAAPAASDDVARKQEVDVVQTNLTNHISATTGVHGATSAATPNAIIQRDVSGRAKVAAPSDADDIATKGYADNAFIKRSGDTMVGEFSIQAPGTNIESAINIIDNTGIRKGRLFYHLDSDRVIFRKYAPSGGIAADLHFNESEFRYRIGSTYYTVYHAANAGPFYKGSGSPEGVVTAPVGSIYQRTDGSAGSTLYVKRSGTGNTGWFAVA